MHYSSYIYYNIYTVYLKENKEEFVLLLSNKTTILICKRLHILKGVHLMDIKNIYSELLDLHLSVDNLKKRADELNIYPNSIQEKDGSILFLSKGKSEKQLIILRRGPLYEAFEGKEVVREGIKLCPLNEANSKTLRELFPYTAPTSHREHDITIGLGDRLGIASPGHIRLIKDYSVFPVLAQQSIRELNLTDRTYEDVLNAASWAVFQEGYTKGFGADGDHLKTHEEVDMALHHGYTMITLDCSEHIDNGVLGAGAGEIQDKYNALPKETRSQLEDKYLDKTFDIDPKCKIHFTADKFKKIVLIYIKAIDFTIDIYNTHIKPLDRLIDFEMSIDETFTPTSPEAHYFVAKELLDGGVEITSLAPRFCGEFEKGIDYIGDIDQFREEFAAHFAISEHFDYKISIHSGSDKFSIFPIVGEITKGRYHLKTAGTNWLEAMRVVAENAPSLYREIHQFALENLHEAKKYYQISADADNIPDVDTLSDEELPGLFDKPDSRQVIHITYGLILQAKEKDGQYRFRDRLYDIWHTYEDDYADRLIDHIGRHIDTLKIHKK